MSNSNDTEKYVSFNKNLLFDARDWEYESKNELRVLMNQKGTYRHSRKEGVLPVTQKQVEHAWDFLNEGKVPTLKTTEAYYSTGYYKRGETNIRYARANQDIELNGKKYKKGWFIPKQD